MSAKLLQKLSANVNVSITRKITSNFPTYSKRDVIAIDAVNDVPDMTTHTEQVCSAIYFQLCPCTYSSIMYVKFFLM